MSTLRYAVRMLLRTPVLSGVVIASLALGIGANTAIYSLMRQILYRDLGIRNSAEIVNLYQPGPAQGRVSSNEDGGAVFTHPMFRDLRKQQSSFLGIAAHRSVDGSLSYQGQSKRGEIALVSGNYFDVLGVRPVLGRLLTEEDDRTPGAHAVVVLNHSYWQNSFGARADVLNKALIVNGHPMTIVGVTQPRFYTESIGQTVDVYVPIMMKAQVTPRWNGLDDRKDYWLYLCARLKSGVTLQQAQHQINVPYRAMLDEEFKLVQNPSPNFTRGWKNKTIVLKPGEYGRGSLISEAQQPLFILLLITGFVLLIACANAANLLLARSAVRRKEIAIRLSIGANRWQLIRQLLVEACVLSMAGGLLGILVSQWTLDLLLAGIPDVAGTQYFNSDLSPHVLLYSFCASILTGLAFGIFPALQATRTDVSPSLKDQGEIIAVSGAAKYFRSAMVVGQIAMSLVLLITSGLLTLSLWRITNIDVGIRTDRLLTFSLNPALSGYTPQRTLQFFEQLENRLSAIPGVQMVGGSTVSFLAGDNWGTNVSVEGYRAGPDTDTHSSLAEIGPTTLATLGIPLLNGREFTPQDAIGAPKVAIVNQTFVKRFLEGRNPLGARFALGRAAKLDIEIVGLIKDAGYASVQDKPKPVFYLPYRQNDRAESLNYYVRTTLQPEQMLSILRREIAALDPTIPVSPIRTMQSQIDQNLFGERIMSFASISFGALATLLAAIGLYGVLAYTVARRTREIGIRIALGARAGDVRFLVMRDVAMFAAIGVPLGLAGGLGIARMLASMLFNVTTYDPFVIGSAVACIVFVAAVAGYLPARRATKIDPQIALRYY
ncbi:MAG: ABC transporter permease [Bryobacterales bacterium]|nr:ABC transporter permease [Bryobacterales bacterium]